MAQARKILLADPDLDAVRALSRALRQKGYQVHYAPDGSRALEIAVLRHPDLILFDEKCTLLEARTFINILRTNPRTEDIPVVLSLATAYSDRVHGLRDGYLRKPFNLDEVLSRLEHLFRRSEAARELKGEAKEIEGTLGQLSLPDLLQVLAMNKRSGRIALERGSERGEISVAEGRPVNARMGPAEGEKALFRLLVWTEGTFAFVPGPVSPRQRIQRAMDDALLEGMRQADEISRLLTQLPPKQARIQFAPGADLPSQQHPVTAQVVAALRVPRTLPELLDLAPATDLDVMAALATLLQKGVARVAEAEPEEGVPILGAAEVHALRTKLFRGRHAPRRAVAKVILCGKVPVAARRLLRELPGALPRGPEPEALRSGFGTLARLAVNEALEIDFCLLPAAEAARPLWRPFSTGAVGALLVDDSEAALTVGRFLAWELRIPVALLGNELPEVLRGAPAGALAIPTSLADTLRALLMQALTPVSPEAGAAGSA